MHVFVFFLCDGFFMIVYDYSDGSRIFFGNHSCPMYGFYGGVMV